MCSLGDMSRQARCKAKQSKATPTWQNAPTRSHDKFIVEAGVRSIHASTPTKRQQKGKKERNGKTCGNTHNSAPPSLTPQKQPSREKPPPKKKGVQNAISASPAPWNLRSLSAPQRLHPRPQPPHQLLPCRQSEQPSRREHAHSQLPVFDRGFDVHTVLGQRQSAPFRSAYLRRERRERKGGKVLTR